VNYCSFYILCGAGSKKIRGGNFINKINAEETKNKEKQKTQA
jgi:hypothetical protein